MWHVCHMHWSLCSGVNKHRAKSTEMEGRGGRGESMKESAELVSTDESEPSGRPDATGIPGRSIWKDEAMCQDWKWQGQWEEGSGRGRVGPDPAEEGHIC